MTKLIERVASKLEFAGYGPVKIVGATDLQLFFNRQLLTFKVGKRGECLMWVDKNKVSTKLTPFIDTENTPPPEIQAVFTIVNALMQYATDFERESCFLNKDVYSFDFDDGALELRTTYGWLEDPTNNKQLVLHELILHDKKLWHKLSETEYDDVSNDKYYVDVLELLTEFDEYGTRPNDLDEELFGSAKDLYRKYVYESI